MSAPPNPNMNTLVRPPSSPLESERVKREKIDSDVSHSHQANANATAHGAAQGVAHDAAAAAQQDGAAPNGVAGGEPEAERYEISFPLTLKQNLKIKEGYPTAVEFHPQNPTLILGMFGGGEKMVHS